MTGCVSRQRVAMMRQASHGQDLAAAASCVVEAHALIQGSL